MSERFEGGTGYKGKGSSSKSHTRNNMNRCGLPEVATAPFDEVSRPPWFAVQVRSRCEEMVGVFLGGNGYQWFLPRYWCRRQWSDRIKEVELPLFPGYLFCRFHPQGRVSILKTPGLISIVGIGKNPVAIEDSEIVALRTLVGSGVPTQPWPYVSVGQKVRIDHGALRGLEGVLQSFKGRHRIVVSVNLLRRSVAAEIDSAWISPVQIGRAASHEQRWSSSHQANNTHSSRELSS
jgi:transcription antitermination factor NusG